ncbi:MAG: DNA/RNA non-specific endonuclease [Spirochaetia bacterium]|nr:DNA/RNA non-specific endonuclease [Spirochaetia bacterium]
MRDVEYKTIGENNIAVPQYYYKVLLDVREPELKGIGLILPNESSSDSLSSFAVSIDRVEQFTGIDFYHSLEDSIEESLETSYDRSLWFDNRDYDIEKREVQEDVEKQSTTAKYWINSGSNSRHNSDCRYYGNTKNGYYTDKKVGDACGICGG